jgi:hypothetical protein
LRAAISIDDFGVKIKTLLSWASAVIQAVVDLADFSMKMNETLSGPGARLHAQIEKVNLLVVDRH